MQICVPLIMRHDFNHHMQSQLITINFLDNNLGGNIFHHWCQWAFPQQFCPDTFRTSLPWTCEKKEAIVQVNDFFWSFYERFLILNLPDITILAHGFFLIGDEEFDSLDRLGTLGASKAIRMVKLIQCSQFGLKDGLVATCAFFPRGLQKKNGVKMRYIPNKAHTFLPILVGVSSSSFFCLLEVSL